MALKTIQVGEISFDERVVIPASKVWIGADSTGEGPATLLHVGQFAIDRYAVTNRRYAAFIKDGGYVRPEFWDIEGFKFATSEQLSTPAFWNDDRFNAPEQPVTGISFFEAVAFAKWACGRLPSEVEWEKAARGTDGHTYPWGEDEPILARANFAPDFIPVQRAPLPVDDYPDGDSPYGCRQMAGNVYEWCADFFHFDTPARRTQNHLIETSHSPRHVLKGGAWTTGADRLRSSARWSYTPALRDNILGFRVAYEVEQDSE